MRSLENPVKGVASHGSGALFREQVKVMMPVWQGVQGPLGTGVSQAAQQANTAARGYQGRGCSPMSPTRLEAGGVCNVPAPPSTPSSAFSASARCSGPGGCVGCPGVQDRNGQVVGGTRNFSSGVETLVGGGPGLSCSGHVPANFPNTQGGKGCFGPDGTFGKGNGHVGMKGFPAMSGASLGASVQDVLRLTAGMNGAQMLALAQFFQEQVRMNSQGLGETFGQVTPQIAEPFLPESVPSGMPLPAGMLSGHVGDMGRMNGDSFSHGDAFSKSEKWIGSPPQPSFEKWKDRESEVLSWAQYVADLSSWASQVSLEFGTEITQASKWPAAIRWSSMTVVMRTRSMRLLAILRSTFMNHPRSAMLISAFMEGVNLHAMTGEDPDSQSANGYELLRQMTCEFSLRTRNEALVFRTSLANKNFTLSAQETSPTSLVTDVVRKIDLEAARYRRLLSTLPADVNAVGLQLSEPDLLMMLVRSLPESARSYVLHHATGESYGAYRLAACRWEQQQRMVSELNLATSVKKLNQVEGNGEIEWFDMTHSDENGEWYLDAVGGVQNGKCNKCGSRKHTTNSCTVDLSRVKCYRCNQYGHVSANCTVKSSNTLKGVEKGKRGVNKGDWSKGKGKSKGKGNLKGFGKKGKMNTMQESQDWSDWSEMTGEDLWWYGDWSGWEQQSWWDVAQVSQDGWRSDEAWQVSASPRNESEVQGKDGNNGMPVGSLVLSPVLCEGSCSCGGLVFEEEENNFVDVLNSRVLVGEARSPAVQCDLSGQLGLQGPNEPYDKELSMCLISTYSRRVLMLDGKHLFDSHCEVSVRTQLESAVQMVQPLLSQMADAADATWWLLDSGASSTVLSQTYLGAFGAALREDETLAGFRAANGSSVSMTGSAEIGVHMFMSDTDGRERVWKKARLKVLVGSIQHNILSITALADSGWKFTQGKHGFDLCHPDMGLHCLEVAYFANCPWVRLHPLKDSSGSALQLSTAISTDPTLCPLTASQVDLETHRRQGHTPFHPQCVECAKGRSVFQHRRARAGQREFEIQADFAFLSQVGEISREESERAFKVLVMSEVVSNAVGYVVVGDDLDLVRKHVVQWLEHFGMVSKEVAVVVHTDAEVAVGELIGRSTGRFNFMVRRASPQQHQSIGHAEKSVRSLKESLAVVRSDLNRQGLDILFSFEGLADVFNYMALSHNHYSRAHGTDHSPLELIAGRKLSKPKTTMFGANVLAEIPDSIRRDNPNEARNIEASFVHVGLVRGAVVQGLVRRDGSHDLVRFTARDIRPILPLTWKLGMCTGYLTSFETHDDVIVGRPPLVGGASQTELGIGIGVDSESGHVDIERLSSEELRKLKSQSIGSRSSEARNLRLEVPAPSRRVRRDGVLRVESSGAVSPTLPPFPGPSLPPFPGHTFQGPSPGPTQPLQVPSPSPLEVPTPTPAGPTSPSGSFESTRRCPACESGMNAPGIRHSSECRKRNPGFFESRTKGPRVTLEAEAKQAGAGGVVVKEVEAGPVAFPSTPVDSRVGGGDLPSERLDVGRSGEYHQRFKRLAETPVADLEEEIRASTENMLVQEEEDFDMFWVATGQPVLVQSLFFLEGPPSFFPATNPEMFVGEFNSIKFDAAKKHDSVLKTLGGTKVRVWKPDSIVDDQSLQELHLEQGFSGMLEEITNLEQCKTGRVTGEDGVRELRKQFSNLRVIHSRWVCAFKSVERVRARIVAKDFNRGATARSMGYSSPTPSVEALHLVLAISSTRKFRLRSLDISHAFMHSPIQSKTKIVLRLPLSVSLGDGSVAFLVLDKALNGLRDASLCWLQLLSETVRKVGLWTCDLEPCVFSGEVVADGHFLGYSIAIVYVDDILLSSSSEEAERHVIQTISDVVPTKVTGGIDEKGGSLTFIGRRIHRNRGDSEIFLSVDPTYLKPTFSEFGITKGSEQVPDVAQYLERAVHDKGFQKPLTEEAYSRFRRGLGRILWLAQVRHDIKTWASIIGTQQSKPTHATEQALRAVLRFLFCDVNTSLCLPSRCPTLSEGLSEEQLRTVHLHSFADASFAPYRHNGRRGLSGGAVFHERCLVRSFARTQQSLTLSSCESELFSIQSVSQESIAFSRLAHRILFSLDEVEEFEPVVVWVESDSSAAIQLLKGVDIPRRSRHVEIRIQWLREQLDRGILHLKHRPGTSNPSDLFTKCLSSRDFFKHRYTLGLVQLDSLELELSALRMAMSVCL